MLLYTAISYTIFRDKVKPLLEQRRECRHGTPTVAIHVSELVPFSDHVGPVDPAPVDRHCAGGGLVPPPLVSGAGGSRRPPPFLPCRSGYCCCSAGRSRSSIPCAAASGTWLGMPATASRSVTPIAAATRCSPRPS